MPTTRSKRRRPPSRRHERYLSDVIARVGVMNGDVARIDPRRVDHACDAGLTASAAAAREVQAGVREARRERGKGRA
jgi:hypothetical protein